MMIKEPSQHNSAHAASGAETGLTPEEQAILLSQDAEAIFTYIYDHRLWGPSESVSGPGSGDAQTERLSVELAPFLRHHDVHSVLDLPCGDFYWMRKALPRDIDYLGGDVVASLIERNRLNAPMNCRFERIDVLKDALPEADALICRDCLVHFSDRHIWQALRQMEASNCRYLLTTTFPEKKVNQNILTGSWRPLNLQAPPFSFPPPLDAIAEGCTEASGQFHDKCLSLWKFSDLRPYILPMRSAS